MINVRADGNKVPHAPMNINATTLFEAGDSNSVERIGARSSARRGPALGMANFAYCLRYLRG